MGFNYSAGVFFGACVRRRTPIGDRLDEIIDGHGGTPAPSAELRETVRRAAWPDET